MLPVNLLHHLHWYGKHGQLPNCSIKWLLLQQQVDGERLKEVLDLNDNEVQMVKSLYQEKGRLSQAFLLAQKNRIIAVVESTRNWHFHVSMSVFPLRQQKIVLVPVES